MKLLLHLSIFFTILSSSYSCTPNDKNALLQIKKSLNNSSYFSSWNPKTDCCSGWNGVECSDGRVTSLIIFSDDVYGQIPTQIGDLPDLKSLFFKYLPHFTGNIPRTITKLKNLEYLWISYTNISSPIPDYISELKTLSFLYLASNQFTGSIPGSLSQMPNLDYIDLSNNKLTGPLPNSMDSFLSNSPSLYLSNNKLSGRIPKLWSEYDFNTVDLSGNRFIGDGSIFFGQNKKTARVNLSENKFEFDLSKVKFAKTIFSLDLSQNKIFGKLPKELTNLNLTEFNVSYNRLCGKIPSGGRLQGFDPYVYSHNKCLCGAPLKPC